MSENIKAWTEGDWDYIRNIEHNAYLRGLKRAEEIISDQYPNQHVHSAQAMKNKIRDAIRAEREKIEKGE